MGSTQTTGVAGTAGGQFGLCTYEGTGSGNNLVFTNETNGASGADHNTNCSGTTQTAGYGTGGGTGSAKFGLNTANPQCASGDPFALENAGAQSTGIIAMVANIPATQQAGLYTTTLEFIATGNY